MRPSWNEYFLKMTKLVSERSTCERRRVGAVIVKDKKILATGYNGAPSGLKHCTELGGCLRQKLNIPSGQRSEICRATHAEQNAIAQAAQYGVSVKGATLYCTNLPCSTCTKIIINSGISEVVYEQDYDDDLAKEMLKESKISIKEIHL